MVDTVETKNKFAVQGKTKLVKGTVTMPEGSGLRLIMVFASESGKPDSDLYKILDHKWRASAELKGWYQVHTTFKMGAVKETSVQSDVWLMNMLVLDKDNKLNEKALATAIKELTKVARYERASVHCSTLLTTAYPELQDLLNTALVEQGVSVSYYVEPTTK